MMHLTRKQQLIAAALLAGAVVLLAARGRSQPAKPRNSAPKDESVVDASKHVTLQAALDSLPASGGVVRIPPGNYEITKPLVLSSESVHVQGSGPATHLINKNEDGQPALVLRPKDFATKRSARIWRVQVSDLRISGNKKSGDGLLAQGVNEIYLHGLSVDHNGGHGINLVSCYEDPRIVNSLMTYNGKAGLNIEAGHDVVVSANQFEENQDALRCLDSFNLCMTGNCVDDHLRHGVVIENTYGSVLSGNMIEECKGTAIVLDRDCYGITLSANVIAHEDGGGIDLRDAWGCAVTGNTFTIVKKNALTIGPASGRITITGNNFSNSWIGGMQKRRVKDPATGVALQGTSDITITGNTFTGLDAHAIEADDKCRRLAIVGNVMFDLGVGPDAKAAATKLRQGAERRPRQERDRQVTPIRLASPAAHVVPG